MIGVAYTLTLFCLADTCTIAVKKPEGKVKPGNQYIIDCCSINTLTLFCLADVCSTAVRKPVGKVKPGIQYINGGFALLDHFESCSTLTTRSLVHEANGLSDG